MRANAETREILNAAPDLLARRELELKVEKLQIETRDLGSLWNRAGKFVPLLVALVSILYSVWILDAKRTLNEAAAERAQQKQAKAEQEQRAAEEQRELAEAELSRLNLERQRLAQEVEELRQSVGAALAATGDAERAVGGAKGADARQARDELALASEKLADVGLTLDRMGEQPRARVYFHIFDESQREEARRVEALIRGQQLARFEGIENVAPKGLQSPGVPQVRFFNDADQQLAEAIANAISSPAMKYSPRRVRGLVASEGTLEIWLVRSAA